MPKKPTIYLTLPDAPERNERRRSTLTGPEVSHVLDLLGVPVAQFCALTGANPMRVEEQLKGIGDDNMPYHYQTILYGLHHLPELRTIEVPLLHLLSFYDHPPRNTRRAGSHFRLKSKLTGAALGHAFIKMKVNPTRFLHLGGINRRRFAPVLQGMSDGDLPMFYETILYILDRMPAIRRLDLVATQNVGPLELPLAEWGLQPKQPPSSTQRRADPD